MALQRPESVRYIKTPLLRFGILLFTDREQVEQFEKSLIAAELTRPHSSMRSLAEALGVPRKTLHDKLRKHGLNFADSAQHSADDE